MASVSDQLTTIAGTLTSNSVKEGHINFQILPPALAVSQLQHRCGLIFIDQFVLTLWAVDWGHVKYRLSTTHTCYRPLFFLHINYWPVANITVPANSSTSCHIPRNSVFNNVHTHQISYVNHMIRTRVISETSLTIHVNTTFVMKQQ